MGLGEDTETGVLRWQRMAPQDRTLTERVAPPNLAAGTASLALMERRKPGRPSKGPRREIRSRLSNQLYDAVHAEAARRGMTVNDLVGEQLAELTGVPYNPQEALKTA